MGWLREFRDEWTQPGFADDQMARMCLFGCVVAALGAAVATVVLIFGDVAVRTVVTLWVGAGVFGIAAGGYAVSAWRAKKSTESR